MKFNLRREVARRACPERVDARKGHAREDPRSESGRVEYYLLLPVGWVNLIQLVCWHSHMNNRLVHTRGRGSRMEPSVGAPQGRGLRSVGSTPTLGLNICLWNVLFNLFHH